MYAKHYKTITDHLSSELIPIQNAFCFYTRHRRCMLYKVMRGLVCITAWNLYYPNYNSASTFNVIWYLLIFAQTFLRKKNRYLFFDKKRRKHNRLLRRFINDTVSLVTKYRIAVRNSNDAYKHGSCTITLERYVIHGCHQLKCLRREGYLADTCWKGNHIVGGNYRNKLLRLGAEPRDLVFKENVTSNAATESLTRIFQGNRDVLEGIPSLVTEFSDILLRFTKRGER